MKKIILALLMILGISSASFALPVLNAPGGIEDVGGNPYSLYQNSGMFLFAQAGNVTTGGAGGADVYNVAELQDLLRSQAVNLMSIADFSNIVLSAAGEAEPGGVSTGFDLTYVDNYKSGTWTTNPLTNTIEFYAVKGSNYFALYYVDPADNSGSWSTYDLLMAGGGGSGEGVGISHFIGYNPSSVPVPEPSTFILLGAGLVGLGLFGRRRI